MFNTEELEKELAQLTEEESQIERELKNYVQTLVGGHGASEKMRGGNGNVAKKLNLKNGMSNRN